MFTSIQGVCCILWACEVYSNASNWLSFVNNVNAEPKVVSMQTTRMSRSSFQKRDTGSFGIGNAGNLFYMINTTIGTPPQNVAFAIDTSSGDTCVIDSALVNDHTQPRGLFALCK
jgi:hypothetical protein